MVMACDTKSTLHFHYFTCITFFYSTTQGTVTKGILCAIKQTWASSFWKFDIYIFVCLLLFSASDILLSLVNK